MSAGMLRLAAESVWELLYPRRVRCVACNAFSHGEMLCESCRRSMEETRLRTELCRWCGYPLSRDGVCDFCRRGGVLLARSAWAHDGAPAQLVLQLKKSMLRDAAPILAEGMAQCAGEMHLPRDLCVTWVPMLEYRYLLRGIDHARVLAEEVGRRLNLPVRMVLRRGRGWHRTQVGKNRAKRLRYGEDAFVCPKAPEHVLLIDDVLTTGATARACVRCLQRAGAQTVYVLTATRAVKRDDL